MRHSHSSTLMLVPAIPRGIMPVGPGLPRLFPFPEPKKFPKPPVGYPTDWVAPSSEFWDPKRFLSDHPIDISAEQWKTRHLVELMSKAKGYPFWQEARVGIIQEMFRRVGDGRMTQTEFFAAVLPFLSNDPQHRKEYVHINEAIILLIPTIQDFSTLKALAEGPMAKGTDAFVKRGIAEGLSYTGNAEVIPYMAFGMKDADATVRREIVRGVGRIGTERSLEVLIPALSDRDPLVRAEAIDALATIKATQAAEKIAGMVRDPNPLVRASAFEALGTLNPPGSAQLIVAGLKDAAYEARIGSMRGLFKVGALLNAEEIAELLKDKEWEVRKVAMRTLWFMGGQIGATGRPGFHVIRQMILALDTEKIPNLKSLLREILTDMLNNSKGEGAGDRGLESSGWLEWWEANKDRWVIPPTGSGVVAPSAVPTVAGTAGTMKKRKFTFDLYGNTAFILDTSGGMGSGGKLTLGTSAIASLLDDFSPDTSFTVLAWKFGGKTVQPPPGDGESITQLPVQKATPAAKAGARKKLSFVTAGGWTPLKAPLDQTINDRRIMEVLYVTDGGANRDVGGNFGVIGGSAERLWEDVRRTLRYHPVVLNGLNVRGRQDFVDMMADVGLGVTDNIP